MLTIRYKLVMHFGRECVDVYYTNERGEIHGGKNRRPWLFPVSDTPHENYHYVAEVNKYVRNTSIN